MIPCLAAMGSAGIEELLGGSRIGQGYAHRAGALQGKIQIFLMQLNSKTGIKGSINHAFAVHLKNTRRGKPAH